MGAFVTAGIEAPFVRIPSKPAEEPKPPAPARPRPNGLEDTKSSDLGG
jgi:hypothetical protein